MASPQDEALARTEVLLRDAEEALQQERMAQFWRDWGSTLIGMALMLVIGTGAGVMWREWHKSKNERATAALMSILEDGKAEIGPEVAEKLGGNHAAIAYLAKAGTLARTPDAATKLAELEKLYAAAAREGDGTVWGWLARLNTLRLKLDDEKADVPAILKQYEDLARDEKGSGLSAMAYMDAALLAGERAGDPARSLEYIAKAEAVVARGSAMMSVLSDLRHLYEVRAHVTAKAPEQKDGVKK